MNGDTLVISAPPLDPPLIHTNTFVQGIIFNFLCTNRCENKKM